VCFVQGGDEKPEVVIMKAEAGGSSTADAVGSPSLVGGQPPIRQVLFNPHIKHLPSMLTYPGPVVVSLYTDLHFVEHLGSGNSLSWFG